MHLVGLGPTTAVRTLRLAVQALHTIAPSTSPTGSCRTALTIPAGMVTPTLGQSKRICMVKLSIKPLLWVLSLSGILGTTGMWLTSNRQTRAEFGSRWMIIIRLSLTLTGIQQKFILT